MKEVIVPADDLVCLGKEKLQEVIRCKDCKHRMVLHYPFNTFICGHAYGEDEIELADYCSKAERKEE